MSERSLSYWQRMLFLMGLTKIPMILFVRPQLLSIDDEKTELKIRLRRRTRNHLKSMYFGVLAVGADTAAGLPVFWHADKLGLRPSFAFKSMEGKFLKRADSDVYFICSDGPKVKAAVQKALDSNERVNETVAVNCIDENGEVVAEFKMEISVKFRTAHN